MKKLVLPFIFIFSLSFAYAASIPKDCHVQACQEVEAWENEYGEMNEHMANQIYNQAYNMCTNGQGFEE